MTTIGVVAALPAEAAFFRGRRVVGNGVVELEGALLHHCGIGARRAQTAAEALVARGVGGLVSWGLAGGLDRELRAGHLLLADEVRDTAGARWGSEPGWRRRLEVLLRDRLRVRVGTLLSTDAVVTSAAEKTRLAATGALGVDMESAALAEVAAASDLPFVVVRAICDEADHDVPRVAVEAVDAAGRLRPTRLAWNLARRPGDWRALFRLRRNLRAAGISLRQVVRWTGHGLARA